MTRLCCQSRELGPFGEGGLESISACLPGLKLFSFVSVCVFARLWDISSHQPGWLDRCNLLSCLDCLSRAARCCQCLCLGLTLPSQAMRDIVAKCLVKDANKRPTAAQLLEHKFFKVGNFSSSGSALCLLPSMWQNRLTLCNLTSRSAQLIRPGCRLHMRRATW